MQFTATLKSDIAETAEEAGDALVQMRARVEAAAATMDRLQASGANMSNALRRGVAASLQASKFAMEDYAKSIENLNKQVVGGGKELPQLVPAGGGGGGKKGGGKGAGKESDTAGAKARAGFKLEKSVGSAEGAVEKAEQAVANAEKKAQKEKDNAAKKADNAAKKAQKDKVKDKAKAEEDLAKLAGKASLAALAGIAVASKVLSFALPLSLGYKGMAKMAVIQARFALDVRKLFSGVDATPVLRAVSKLEENFSQTTVTGRVMKSIITRAFSGIFAIFERLSPYITAFGQGIMLAFVLLENASLEAQIELVPLTSMLDDLVDQGTLCKIVFYGVAGAVGLVAASVALLSLPIIFFVAAVTLAIKLYDKLHGLISGDTATKVPRKAPRKATDPAAAKSDGKATDPAAAKSDGKASGDAIGLGLIVGMGGQMGAVAKAGAALAKAADGGVRAEAQIKSPSRKMRKNAGYMGEGVILGLQDSEDAVQDAAAKSLVPKLDSAPKGGAKGVSGKDGGGLTINFHGPVGGAVADFEAAVRRALTIEVRDAVMTLGGQV